MLTTIGEQRQSKHVDAAAAGLMVSNCANRLVTAGWQCMRIWLSSDVPVLATPVLSCLSVSLETDNHSRPHTRAACQSDDVALCRSHRSSVRRLDQSLTSAGRRPDVRNWMTTRCRCTWRPLDVSATSLCLLGSPDVNCRFCNSGIKIKCILQKK